MQGLALLSQTTSGALVFADLAIIIIILMGECEHDLNMNASFSNNLAHHHKSFTIINSSINFLSLFSQCVLSGFKNELPFSLS